MRRRNGALTLSLLLLSCSRTPSSSRSLAQATGAQVSTEAVRPAVTEDVPRRAERPRWPRSLPPASVMGDGEGRWLRTVVHAHSVHSGDACDERPFIDGVPNEACLQRFRRAACETKLDLIFLTEHADRMARVDFDDVMQLREGDEPLRDGGALVGYRIACPGGHRVMVLPGAENDLMPLGLTRHPAPVERSLAQAYHSGGARGARLFREAGALVGLAHGETRSRAEVRAVGPDVIELYNVHANVDPDIARPRLGIDVARMAADVFAFYDPRRSLDPEWGFLAVFRENRPDLAHWAALVAEGRRVTAVAGSDAHENRFPIPLPDGERGDSYRRIFRWYSNVLRVEGEPTRESVMRSLAEGRLWAVIEAWGTPEGFSFRASTRDGTTGETGDTLPLDARVSLQVTAPRAYGLDPSLPSPSVRVRLLRAERDGDWREVARGAEALAFDVAEPGAYRAEALIVPHHARPYLPGMERLVREVPWVYSNVIRVR